MKAYDAVPTTLMMITKSFIVWHGKYLIELPCMYLPSPTPPNLESWNRQYYSCIVRAYYLFFNSVAATHQYTNYELVLLVRDSPKHDRKNKIVSEQTPQVTYEKDLLLYFIPLTVVT